MTFFRAEAEALLEATVVADDEPLEAVFAGEEAEDEELDEAVLDGLALEDGEDEDAVLPDFDVVLVPVLLAVFVPVEVELVVEVFDGLVLEDGEDEVLDEDAEALARSDL
ncbi:MAG: hypothetical protein M1532_00255 [Nitrospirae bacterium]|nr:hypothetical protein [Nitrospirota bacterium]